jgi:SAM-dependent methyltransferase
MKRPTSYAAVARLEPRRDASGCGCATLLACEAVAGARVKIDYDEKLWKGYAQGRALPRQSLTVWMDAVARYADPRRPLTVLDLGSGTGRFSPSLAEWFGGPIYGVEPAAKMREVAGTLNAHPAVIYLAGRAEHIPLADASCDLAFLFFVLHHFEDPQTAAAELARVVRPSGIVCIRTQFSDRLRDIAWRRYFPRALEIEREMFPTVDETTATFRRAGFEPVALDEVEFDVAANPLAHLERLRHRAISTLELLSEDEVEAGLRAMERAAASADPTPVRDVGDMLIIRNAMKETACS